MGWGTIREEGTLLLLTIQLTGEDVKGRMNVHAFSGTVSHSKLLTEYLPHARCYARH